MMVTHSTYIPPCNMPFSGFALLEVLLTLFVLSVGLLGMAGAELIAVHRNQEAYLQSVAMVSLANMAERLRVNKSLIARNAELVRWNQDNAQLLPQGEGGFQCLNNKCTVSIHWQMSKKEFQSLMVSL